MVIAIIAVLISLLLPALSAAKEAGRTVKCLSNERQIGIAVAAYVQDEKEWWPTSSYPFCGHPYHYCALWAAIVAHYAHNPYITEYPTNTAAYPDEAIFTTYAEPRKPNQGILKCPSDTTTNAWGGPTSVSYAYNGTYYGLGVNDYFSQPDADFYYGSAAGPLYAEGYGRQRSTSLFRYSTTVLVADVNSQDGYEYSGYQLSSWNAPPTDYGSLATYHFGGTNVLWLDGHANSRKAEAMNANDFDRRY